MRSIQESPHTHTMPVDCGGHGDYPFLDSLAWNIAGNLVHRSSPSYMFEYESIGFDPQPHVLAPFVGKARDKT